MGELEAVKGQKWNAFAPMIYGVKVAFAVPFSA